jgi:hypothetical protein
VPGGCSSPAKRPRKASAPGLGRRRANSRLGARARERELELELERERGGGGGKRDAAPQRTEGEDGSIDGGIKKTHGLLVGRFFQFL